VGGGLQRDFWRAVDEVSGLCLGGGEQNLVPSQLGLFKHTTECEDSW
jgi:hypothetical protein